MTNRLSMDEHSRLICIDSHPTKQITVGVVDKHGNRIPVVRLRPQDVRLGMCVRRDVKLWFEYEEYYY